MNIESGTTSQGLESKGDQFPASAAHTATIGPDASITSGLTVALWQLPVIWNVPVDEDVRFLMRGVVSGDRSEPVPIPAAQMSELVRLGYFDAGHYLAQQDGCVDDETDLVERFRSYGCHGRHQPNIAFDNVWYRTKYQDVAESGVPPLLHYYLSGEKEWRRPILWFDTAWYVAQYSDEITESGPLVHYLHNRKSGRYSPNPLFDCSYYLAANRDAVAAVGGDPFEHFLRYGHKQDLNPAPTFDLNLYRQAKLSGKREINPLLHALAGAVGYKIAPVEVASLEELEQVNLGAEPGSLGSLENNAPNDAAEFAAAEKASADALILVAPVTSELDAAPLASVGTQRVRIAYEEIARDPAKLASIVAEARDKSGEALISPSYQGDLEVAASEFDFHYYVAEYPEIWEQGLDPLLHYFEAGWELGYDPAPWFSTRYYLTSNPDIAKAKVNPFWHFLVAGRNEGRLPKQSAGRRREILSNLKTPDQKTAHYCTPEHVRLTKDELFEAIAAAIKDAEGAVLSISHDCYPHVVGGTQVFIADEQRKFNERKYSYLHLSPLLGALRMREIPAEDSILRLVIDGQVIGAATGRECAEAIRDAFREFPGPRVFAVHCILGHSADALLAVHDAFRPLESFYWLHDYSSLCPGLNLLRNDVDFCGAPAVGSMACNVCIYGDSRQAHVHEVTRLFEACNFRVVAPSDAARDIWLKSAHLPHNGAITVAHSLLKTTGVWRDPRPSNLIGLPQHKVRVAFIGYQSVAKGWSAFERIVQETCGLAAYEFYHFATKDVPRSTARVNKVDVSVTAQDRDSMVRALTDKNIDIVVNSSIWPETFSYTLFESLAAGCDVVTVADSGNIAAKVQETGRGLVLPNEDALVEFFVKGGAIAWVRARAREGIYRGVLQQTGTTVAVLFNHL